MAQPIVVAMIDTGVRATHQEFDYGGATDTTDQFVAWWDFSSDAANHLPAPGQTWDTTFADPYDPNGHGTSTASLAVGLNTGAPSVKRASFAPGYKLAVAKVGNVDGAIDGDIAAAIKWARDTVGADVISMSIGAIAPIPAVIDSFTYREIRIAREAGVLVVVSNGNGWANAGVPGEPGFASAYGNSTDVLGVGASDIDGPTVTTDPEVAAEFWDVPAASRKCDTCYEKVVGTSFGTPLVAGFAAALANAAAANGHAPTPAYIETLVKYSARDTVVPPTFEGFGVIDAAQWSAAHAHASAGTLPSRPSPDVNALYVDTVQHTLDDAWTNKAVDGLKQMHRTFIGAVSPVGTIGASAPSGLSEVEVLQANLSVGDTFTVDVSYAAPDAVNDIDVYVFRGPGTSFDGLAEVASSASEAGVDESVSFRAPSSGTYSVVVQGWSVATGAAYSISSSHALTRTYQDYVLHTFGTGLY